MRGYDWVCQLARAAVRPLNRDSSGVVLGPCNPVLHQTRHAMLLPGRQDRVSIASHIPSRSFLPQPLAGYTCTTFPCKLPCRPLQESDC